MKKKNIAIIAGGNSFEYDISVKSAMQMQHILDKEKYNSQIIIIKGNEWFLQHKQFGKIYIDKNDFSLSANNYAKTIFDCALIMTQGSPGEDGHLQSYFELIGLPYTSSKILGSSLAYHKYQCKKYLEVFHVKSPDSILIKRNDEIKPVRIIEYLGLPCFVKPNTGGSGFGVMKINNVGLLKSAIEQGLEITDSVLVEKHIPGDEITCGLFKTQNKEYTFPLTLVLPSSRTFSNNSKSYNRVINAKTPSGIHEDAEAECKMAASMIYDLLECRGIISVDFIVSGNKPYFLEVNTIPAMTNDAIIPKQIEKFGISVTDIFSILIDEAIENR